MTGQEGAATTIRQLNADGMVVGAQYDSLAALRRAALQTVIDTDARARAVQLQLLVLTTSVDASAVDVEFFGFCEHGERGVSYATSECTGSMLVIEARVYDGDLAAAADALTKVYNAVFGQSDTVQMLSPANICAL